MGVGARKTKAASWVSDEGETRVDEGPSSAKGMIVLELCSTGMNGRDESGNELKLP